MSVAARELEAEIMGILYSSGAKVLDRGRDGAGHQTVTFRLHDAEKTFHYAMTTRMNGHTRRNVGARLRRIIREIPEAPNSPPHIVAETTETNASMMAEPPTPTPPKLTRLSSLRRKEIAKRYVVLRDIEKLIEETGVPHHKLHILLNASGGQAQRLYRRDLNKKRIEANRSPAPPTVKTVVTKVKKAIKSNLPILPPAKRGAYADNFRRDVLIARMVYVDNVPVEEVARHAGVSASRIGQIAKANYEHRHWKFG